MKRLVIVCEGPTEQEFCKDMLTSYFLEKGIWLEAPTIKHSNGGIVAWDTLKKQLVNHLNEGDVLVSLLIDYYQIKEGILLIDSESFITVTKAYEQKNANKRLRSHIASTQNNTN